MVCKFWFNKKYVKQFDQYLAHSKCKTIAIDENKHHLKPLEINFQTHLSKSKHELIRERFNLII